jgi:hypothetical protein
LAVSRTGWGSRRDAPAELRTSERKSNTELPEARAIEVAGQNWDEINGRNLRENILPTRERATLILTKGDGHRIERVRLRKL